MQLAKKQAHYMSAASALRGATVWSNQSIAKFGGPRSRQSQPTRRAINRTSALKMPLK